MAIWKMPSAYSPNQKQTAICSAATASGTPKVPPICWTSGSLPCWATATGAKPVKPNACWNWAAYHGHGYSVKSSLLPLRRRALELDVQLVLYGHTHLPALSEEEGVLFCNPGSCMGDRLYAEIELQDGKVADARLCQAEHRITRRMKPTWWKS